MCKCCSPPGLTAVATPTPLPVYRHWGVGSCGHANKHLGSDCSKALAEFQHPQWAGVWPRPSPAGNCGRKALWLRFNLVIPELTIQPRGLQRELLALHSSLSNRVEEGLSSLTTGSPGAHACHSRLYCTVCWCSMQALAISRSYVIECEQAAESGAWKQKGHVTLWELLWPGCSYSAYLC